MSRGLLLAATAICYEASVPDTVRLAGLDRPVRLLRDRFGIPHLLAESRPDAYRALGYAMARDRLWQMDLMRRLGAGRRRSGIA